MKKDITVGAKVGGVFGTGAFENLRVAFDFSVTYKDVEDLPGKQFLKDLAEAQEANQKAYQELYKQMEFAEEQAKQKAIAKFHKNIRWYDAGNGLKYPSVTSVIDFANPIEWFVDDLKKRGLAARGMVVDHVLQAFIKDSLSKKPTGKFIEPEKLPECIRHLAIMKDAGYDIDGFNLPAFVEKFKVKFTAGHRIVVNHKDGYAGQPDCECTFDGGPVTLADLKCFNPDAKGKLRTLKQTAAYAMAVPVVYTNHPTFIYEKIAIIPIHGKAAQGYSKPVITDEIEKYFALFLEDRKVFKDTFGI